MFMKSLMVGHVCCIAEKISYFTINILGMQTRMIGSLRYGLL